MAIPSLERRANPRIAINGDMTYCLENSEEFLRGEIENMSADGARIWIEHELPPDSRLLLRVESNDPAEAAMEFHATLLHRMPDRKGLRFGYGCFIETC